jgi:hypothetical protein
MVPCFFPPSCCPETKALLHASLHHGGTNLQYKGVHDPGKKCNLLPVVHGRDAPRQGVRDARVRVCDRPVPRARLLGCLELRDRQPCLRGHRPQARVLYRSTRPRRSEAAQ